MHIHGTDPTRRRTIEAEENDRPANAEPRATARVATAAPDWDRFATNAAVAASAAATSKEPTSAKQKIERLVADLNALREVCRPIAEHVEEGLHASHKIQEAVEVLGEAVKHPHLAIPLVAVAVATLGEAIPEYLHALEKVAKEGKPTVENAKPIVARIRRDIADLAGIGGAAPRQAAAELPIERFHAPVRG